jgi:hypothetical protein
MAQVKAQLDAGVADGSISRADADAAYAALQQKVAGFLTSSLGGPAGGKQAPKP